MFLHPYFNDIFIEPVPIDMSDLDVCNENLRNLEENLKACSISKERVRRQSIVLESEKENQRKQIADLEKQYKDMIKQMNLKLKLKKFNNMTWL
jgi:hypothetical protein